MVKITLREVREDKKKTIKQLSKMSGVSMGHISKIETGQSMPTIDVLIRIAIALDVKLEELYILI